MKTKLGAALRLLVLPFAFLAGIAITAALCRLLFPCFPSRGLDWFPFLYGLLVALIHVLIHRDPDRSFAGRLGLAALLGFVAILLSSAALSNLFGAYDRSKQKWTMSQMRTLGAFLKDVQRPIPLSPIDRLPEWRAATAGGEPLPDLDGWGTPLRVQIRGDDRYVVSCGACGAFESTDATSYGPAETSNYEDDLVLANDTWVRYPTGIQT